MKANETNLEPVLEGTKQYVIPLFQRSYSWERKQWEPLWNDVVDIAESETVSSHFLGSIVTMPAKSVPEGVTKYVLIDGQQRITTILVLLAAIRDVSKDEEGTLSQEIDEQLLTNKFKSGDEAAKLLPTQADREVFRSILKGQAANNPESRLWKAKSYFDRKLKSDNRPSSQALRKAITQQLTLVSIVLDNNDDPHLIFESLNARGLPLNQADLIRNYFLMRFPVGQQEEIYKIYWEPIEDLLGDNTAEFMRHFLSRQGASIKKGDVYLFLKERTEHLDGSQLIQYLADLVSHAKYYAILLGLREEPDPKISRYLSRLRDLDFTVAHPFLLNVFEERSSGRLTSNDAADILATLENFLIRRMVCSVPTFGLNKDFPPLFVQASQYGTLPEGVKAILQTKRYPRDPEFFDRLKSGQMYAPGDRIPKIKLLLGQLEASFGHKEAVPPDGLTIEHVLPQTLTDWWRVQLGESAEQLHELMVNTLGNLTLTAYNSELSNDSFPKKQARLAQSHIELNKYFGNLENWDADAITLRAHSLAEKSLEIWPYFGTSQSANQNGLESVTGKKPLAVRVVGQRISVDTWRDVCQVTIEAIHDLDPDAYQDVKTAFPRFVGPDASKFRSTRSLKNGDFIEVHLSADAIYRFCVQATEIAELSLDEWAVETS